MRKHVNQKLEKQIEYFKRLNYEFYLALSNGKGPLTYTSADDKGNEFQIEVNC